MPNVAAPPWLMHRGAREGDRLEARFAPHLNDFAWPVQPDQVGPTLSAVARAAEEAGFDTIAVMDHVWQHPMMGGPEQPVLECYATLAYLAAHTSRARLIALATPVSYRFAGMLVKTVTALDVLSGGRAWLGIGVGDYEEEARGLGIPFPGTTERYALMEETIQACLSMWKGEHGDDEPFEGSHVRMDRPLNLPQSLSRPHPPILIAGSGERRTLPLVARYADACNLRPGPDLPRTLQTLRTLCEAEGRDFESIEKTCPWRFDVGRDGRGVDSLIEQLHGFAEMGIDTVIGRVIDEYRIEPIEIMAREVIPAVMDF